MLYWPNRLASLGRWLFSEGLARVRAPHHRPRRAHAPGRVGPRRPGAAPPWYPRGTPPRRHNRVTPLVDGAAYFSALHDALVASQDYIYIAGWCLSPDVPLVRHDHQVLVDSRLLPILAAAARRIPVRILLWSGAPLLYQPTRAYTRAVQARFAQVSGDLDCRLDTSAPFSHTHHQKAVVIDGRIAFLGGMDLTTFAGDRWDGDGHRLRSGGNWHDLQVAIEGEAVADVEANFRQRWAAVAGPAPLPTHAPVVDPAWNTPVQIVRTIPRRVYPFARRGEFGIRYTLLAAIAGARRLIYIENQYLWSPEIMAALIAVLHQQRDTPFRLVIVLPAEAQDGKWDNDKHVDALRAADEGRGQAEIYTLYTSAPHAGSDSFTYRPIYVHAKVVIIDDTWLLIGSANLNTRSLRTDSELNAVIADPARAGALRAALWAEHLRLPPAQVAATDPTTLVDGIWRDQARTNARIFQRRDRPLISAVQRYESGRMPGTFLLEDAEALTFDR